MLRATLIRQKSFRCVLRRSNQWSQSLSSLPPTKDSDQSDEESNLEAKEEQESRPPPLTEEAKKQLESIWSEYNNSYQHQRTKGWKT
mmetsp:Transcript_9815/g.13622  ORF Transcript_9815/g.13622 Transcript_9815/m.13622 type:complete len:87 (-) Transcript_9815:159-419(-)